MSGQNEIKDNKIKYEPLLVSCVILLLGFSFYYLFCPDVFFVKILDKHIPKGYHIIVENNWITRLFRNYGLDILWAFAFSNALLFFTCSKKEKMISIMCVIVIGVGLEALQYLSIIHGTADWVDIVSEALGSVFSWITYGRRKKHK